MKKHTYVIFSVLSLFIGVSVLLFCIVLPILSLMNSDQGSVGIIGGADGPTAQFITQSMISYHLLEIHIGVVLIIAGLFCLIFSKTVKASCSIKTTALSLGISATGGVGLFCFLLWLVIIAFGETSKHPIEFTASKIGGFFCLALFILLMVFYIKQRKAFKSVKGVVIDVLTSILFLPTFFLFFDWLHKLIG